MNRRIGTLIASSGAAAPRGVEWVDFEDVSVGTSSEDTFLVIKEFRAGGTSWVMMGVRTGANLLAMETREAAKQCVERRFLENDA